MYSMGMCKGQKGTKGHGKGIKGTGMHMSIEISKGMCKGKDMSFRVTFDTFEYKGTGKDNKGKGKDGKGGKGKEGKGKEGKGKEMLRARDAQMPEGKGKRCPDAQMLRAQVPSAVPHPVQPPSRDREEMSYENYEIFSDGSVFMSEASDLFASDAEEDSSEWGDCSE